MIKVRGKSVTIKNNYFIGNAPNASTVIQLGDGRSGYIIRNNTFNIESSGGLIGVYSLNTATADFITSGRNNLFIIETGSPYGFGSQNSVNGEITAATNNYFIFTGTEYFNILGGSTGTNDKSGSADLLDSTVTKTNFTNADALNGTITRITLFNIITTALTPTASSILIDAGSALDSGDPLTINGTRDIGAAEYSP